MFVYLKANRVSLKIKKPRNSKLGDYRHPYGDLGHRISINSNLNPFAFLITLVHEMAHLETWEMFGNHHIPHGQEWKDNFSKMLREFVNQEALPADIRRALADLISKPGASSCNDLNLSRVLAKYDRHEVLHLEKLPTGSVFILETGRRFRKGQRLRKRFKCFCLDDEKWYYVHPLVPVEVISKPD
ncbi:MAG: sprT domain-containing protein [Bacteroidetes bacterium]|nr:sprT domain-containing protein [Bacteroidota bacterium]